MRIETNIQGRKTPFCDVFDAAFTASEGPQEGQVIRDLASRLLASTPETDMIAVAATSANAIMGGCLLTRLRFAQDPRVVWLLSPVAVHPDHQGTGVGQAMLAQALNDLRARGADAAITYGDPAFYKKVGFGPISAAIAAPPYPLSQPHGWLGQSLNDAPLRPLAGSSSCAAALADPVFW
ncbi:GNAT family N-acetyltransferase [Aliiroseovarius sp. PTFE2010]|uniref:GNAT family N-acetyltransferase n=1 Tax=Aliiroseovarius sp. PTFE2010 TaxID=3417190 RepID=UPI003CEB88B1